MKKFISLILVLFYFLSTNACFADVSNLYFVKNTDKSVLTGIVENACVSEKYTLQKKDPYYALLTSDNSKYAIVILQKTGVNVFYYFQSNGNNKLDKNILKVMKANNIVYEQSFNDTYLDLFKPQAQKVLFNQEKQVYNFENPSVQQSQTIVQSAITQPQNLTGYVEKVVEGSKIRTYLQTPINTANAMVGDAVKAVLTEDWIYNGHLIAPQGSVVIGTLSKAKHATYGSQNGSVSIVFNQLITPENKAYNISTEKIDFHVSNDGKFGSSVSTVVKGAVTGLLVGLLFAALSASDSRNYGRSSAIGAATGAGAGLITAVAEAGVDAEIPIYTELEIKLTKPLSVVIGN